MKSSTLAFLAWALLASQPGRAASIVQTFSAELQNVGNGFAVPVQFNAFDPTLGILDAITLNLSARFSGSVSIENLSSSPDMAQGIIGGNVLVENNDQSLFVQVFPSASGPLHDLAPYDQQINFAPPSGATDSVTGSPQSASTTVTGPASLFQMLTGTGQIFLTLSASSFPIAEGQQTESVEETANALSTVELTYDFTPGAAAAPEPSARTMLATGLMALTLALRKRAFSGSSRPLPLPCIR